MDGRSPAELELLEKATRFLPGATLGNIALPEALRFLAREGKGPHLQDVSGNTYIDWLMGSGPMVLGHAHPAVVDAVVHAVERGSHYFTTNELAVELAEAIVEAIPCAEQLRYTTSGTDANFQCLRAARVFRKRDRVLKFEGGFHGTSDYALMSVSPAIGEVDYPRALRSSGGIPTALEDLVLTAPFNDLETTTRIIEENHEELAAVILEPLQRVIPPVAGFLEGLREVTARHGVLLIFDEVVTGFRLSYGGAQEYYGVVPDLCSVGKIVGGGYPLAAAVGRRDVLSCYDASLVAPGDFVNQIGTLNGNPIACAAGLATLAELRKPGTYETLREIGGGLRGALTGVLERHGIAAQCCGDDTAFDIVFSDRPIASYRDTAAADGEKLARLNAGLLEHRILKSWPQKFYPSLVHGDEDITRTAEALEALMPRLG